MTGRPADWPSLDERALYGLAGQVVGTIAPHTEADPVALLLDFLPSFGNAIGAGPHMRVGGAAHPARLNVCEVGDTASGRKGQSRAEIARVFLDADPDWAGSRVMGGLASGEGLIAAVRDPDPEDEQPRTVDRRLLAAEPEFARVLAVASREGSTVSAVIRQAWDTGDLRVLTRKDPLTATGAHISVLAHITPEELVRRLSESDARNGFANRFLFALVNRSQLLPFGGDLTDDDFVRLGRLVRTRLMEARRVVRAQRTEECDELWEHLYREIAERRAEGLHAAVTARSEVQLLRLSLTYALTDGVGKIDVPHLEAAWAVLCYCDASAALIFRATAGDPVVDRILHALEQHPEGLDRTALYGLFARHVRAAELNRALDELEADGTIEQGYDTTGTGRPRDVYALRNMRSGEQTGTLSLSSLPSHGTRRTSFATSPTSQEREPVALDVEERSS